MEVVTDVLDPLGGLPSLSSLTRVKTSAKNATEVPSRNELVPLLEIDPVLMLRALRFCSSKLLGRPALAKLTPAAILNKLGPGAVSRMVSAPVPPTRELAPLFQLWLHAIASAIASKSLAELGNFAPGVDPEEAHACALVHDLPLWGHLSNSASTTTRSPWSPLEWSRAWSLPDQVQVSWLAAHCGTTEADTHAKLAKTVVSGEALAILAGYGHPGTTSRVEVDLVRHLAGRDLSQLVDQVRAGVQATVQAAGLAIEQLEQPPHPETLQTSETRAHLPFEEGIVKLQEVGGSERYRPVLTSLVAGVCHYLGFDRCFYTQWIGKGQTLLIRTKYDRTAVPVGGRMVVPSPREAALMGRVAGLGESEILRRCENFRYKLLDHLACDTLLVVPVCGVGATHGVMLLDRSYSCQQRISPRDPTKALAIAGVCGQTLSTLLLKRQDERSRREAQTDMLTGLLNRRAALNQLERQIQRNRRKQLPMAVLMLDLDHFKGLNDKYGHLMGDRVLAKVGSVLRSTIRGSDVAARYGGEEFLVAQFDTTIEEASIVAARIYKAIEEAGSHLGVPITISVGLTDLRAEDTVETLLQRADKALYASKRRGRNRFSVDSP